jgi:hypothetical protein
MKQADAPLSSKPFTGVEPLMVPARRIVGTVGWLMAAERISSGRFDGSGRVSVGFGIDAVSGNGVGEAECSEVVASEWMAAAR